MPRTGATAHPPRGPQKTLRWCPSGQDRGFILWASRAIVTSSSSPSRPLAQEVGQVTLGKGSPRLPSGGRKHRVTCPASPSSPGQTRRALRTQATVSDLAAPGRDPGENRCPFHLLAVCRDRQPLQREPQPCGQLRPRPPPVGGAEAPAPLARCRCHTGWLCLMPPFPEPLRWNYSPGLHPRGRGTSRRSRLGRDRPGWVACSGPRASGLEVPHGDGRGSGAPPWGLRGEEGKEV